jgi:hypothetical protein
MGFSILTTRNLAFWDTYSATLGSKMSQSALLQQLLRPLWSTAAYFKLKSYKALSVSQKKLWLLLKNKKKSFLLKYFYHYRFPRISLPQLNLSLILTSPDLNPQISISLSNLTNFTPVPRSPTHSSSSFTFLTRSPTHSIPLSPVRISKSKSYPNCKDLYQCFFLSIVMPSHTRTLVLTLPN